MKAAVDALKLAKVAEETLKGLGFDFAKNEGPGLVEFEVSTPAHFVARLTALQEPVQPVALLGSILTPKRKVVDVELLFSGDDASARGASASFVKGILASLQKPPWKGLGFVESITAKALWQEAAEGSA